MVDSMQWIMNLLAGESTGRDYACSLSGITCQHENQEPLSYGEFMEEFQKDKPRNRGNWIKP